MSSRDPSTDPVAILRALPLREWMEWSFAQFPGQPAADLLDHLGEELDELHAALGGAGDVAEEAVDVCAMAVRLALTLVGAGLPDAMARKLEVNRGRDWSTRRPDHCAVRVETIRRRCEKFGIEFHRWHEYMAFCAGVEGGARRADLSAHDLWLGWNDWLESASPAPVEVGGFAFDCSAECVALPVAQVAGLLVTAHHALWSPDGSGGFKCGVFPAENVAQWRGWYSETGDAFLINAAGAPRIALLRPAFASLDRGEDPPEMLDLADLADRLGDCYATQGAIVEAVRRVGGRPGRVRWASSAVETWAGILRAAEHGAAGADGRWVRAGDYARMLRVADGWTDVEINDRAWQPWPPPPAREGCTLLVFDVTDSGETGMFRAHSGTWYGACDAARGTAGDLYADFSPAILRWRIIADPVERADGPAPEPAAWVPPEGHCPSCGEDRLKTGCSASWCEQNDCQPNGDH